MTFNKELANRVLEQIEAHPETWDQSEWACFSDNECGTSHCFAGWAVMLTDPYELNRDEQAIRNRREVDIQGQAMSALGLNYDFLIESEYRAVIHPLFNSNNSLEDLKRLVIEYSKE